MTDPALAGIFGIFADFPPPDESQADLIVNSFVPLNKTILKLSGQSSLEPEFVVPYLAERIDWSIIKVRYQLHRLCCSLMKRITWL